MAFGRIDGPSACGEFIRMETGASTEQPSIQRLAIATPAFLRTSASGDPKSARPNGALFEMCCTFVPVLTNVFASASSHFRPAALNGSKPVPCGLPAAKYIASSTMSPKKPEKMSMRMNSPQALGPSIRPNAIPRSGDGYPRNLEIVPLMNAAIESYKEMADFGGKYGVKVTFENHWGLAADPMNIRIMIDAVNHPYCDATPDFGNWEHEHMLFSGIKALAPYTSSNVHAKYWDRWGDANDVQRSVRIMMAAGFKGTFALEYEAGPLNGVEGAKYLYKEVLAALSTLTS